MSRSAALAIVSLSNDPHALVVRGMLRRRFGVPCEIVPVDRIADSGALHWTDDDSLPSRLPALHGGTVDVAGLQAIWWRRARARAVVPGRVTDAAALEQISQDCDCALASLVRVDFAGRWVSDPDATRIAECKVLQLRTAPRFGLRVPRTLVSQAPEEIRAFAAECGGALVVKPLTTRRNAGVAAGLVTPELLRQDDVLRLSPALWQEAIPGTRHLRVHVFGDEALGALIEAEDLDWRYHLAQSRITPHAIDETLRRALAGLLARLRLRMGIFDLKLAPDGTPVWLELNPQGQFLFVEGLCGLPLCEAMARFLAHELRDDAPRVPAMRAADATSLAAAA